MDTILKPTSHKLVGVVQNCVKISYITCCYVGKAFTRQSAGAHVNVDELLICSHSNLWQTSHVSTLHVIM